MRGSFFFEFVCRPYPQSYIPTLPQTCYQDINLYECTMNQASHTWNYVPTNQRNFGYPWKWPPCIKWLPSILCELRVVITSHYCAVSSAPALMTAGISRFWTRPRITACESWWVLRKSYVPGSSRSRRSRPSTTPWTCVTLMCPTTAWSPSAGPPSAGWRKSNRPSNTERSVLLIKHGTVNSHGQTQNRQFTCLTQNSQIPQLNMERSVLLINTEQAILTVKHRTLSSHCQTRNSQISLSIRNGQFSLLTWNGQFSGSSIMILSRFTQPSNMDRF